MELNNYSDFKTDLEWSKSFTDQWDNFYKSKHFELLLQKMRRKKNIKIVNIDHSDNILFQKETHLDTVVALSSGSSLLIDEKVLRYPKNILRYPSCINEFPIEVCCNPNTGGKHDGWGYHIGITICMVYTTLDNLFLNEPVVFTISNRFINEIVRNDVFHAIPSKSTGGLYSSICKWIPRNILKEYFP